MDNHIFRSAIGGFHRQDVTDYIEKTQRQADERAAELERQADELRAALAAAEERLAQSGEALEARAGELAERDGRIERLTLERDTARHNWDAQHQANVVLREDAARHEEAARALREENQVQAARLAALEAETETLRREKERVAQLELDARHRSDEVIAQAEDQAAAAIRQAEAQAQIIIKQAEAQAAATVSEANARAQAVQTQAQTRSRQLLQETEDRIAATAGRYSEQCQSFNAVIAHITSELRKLDVTAGQLPLSFNALKEELARLREQAKER